MLAARYFSARIAGASREQRARSGSLTAVTEESLSNITLVQAYDRHATERFHRENPGRFRAEMAATRLEALLRPLMELLEILGVILVLGLGVRELRHGRISLGGLLVFLTCLHPDSAARPTLRQLNTTLASLTTGLSMAGNSR